MGPDSRRRDSPTPVGYSSEVRLNPEVEDRWSPYGWVHRPLSAKLTRPVGDVYLSLHVLDVENTPDVTLHILEIKWSVLEAVPPDTTYTAENASRVFALRALRVLR